MFYCIFSIINVTSQNRPFFVYLTISLRSVVPRYFIIFMVIIIKCFNSSRIKLSGQGILNTTYIHLLKNIKYYFLRINSTNKSFAFFI